MGCNVFQILTSAKLQTPAIKNAITLTGVSHVTCILAFCNFCANYIYRC